MTLEEALVTKLNAESGVTALIGTRFYPNVIPAGATLTAAAYQRISTDPIIAHDGPTGLATARIQISVQAVKYADAKAAARAIRIALNGVNGTWGTVEIQRSALDNENDTDELVDASVVRQDYQIMYKEQ